MMPPVTRLLAVALLAGCAQLGSEREPPSPLDFSFDGPGRLVLIWQVPDGEGGVSARLVVHDSDGARALPISGAAEARWLGPDALILSLAARSDDPSRWGLTELVVLELERPEPLRLAAPRRHFNLEPSPDRSWLAVGVEVSERGDSDLEIWYVGGEPQVVARRREPFDEPRWSPDGAELIVSRAIQDPEAEEPSASLGGVGFAWPRLFRVRRDLGAAPILVRDGEPEGHLSPGGSFPLWWDRAGIFARQRRGLVRCDPGERGCVLVYDPGENRRVVDGRKVGDDTALLLVLDTGSEERLASEIHRVDLATGSRSLAFRTPPSAYVTDIDWTATAAE
jgi:hypothetical protein